MKRTLLFSIFLCAIVAKGQSNGTYDNVFTNNIFSKGVIGIPSEQEHYHISNQLFSNGFWGLDVKWWGGINLHAESGSVNFKSTLGDMVLSSGGNLGLGTANPQAKLDVNFNNEPKSIRFYQPSQNSNPLYTMVSSLRFNWYNETTDVGMIRGGSDNIIGIGFSFNGNEKMRFASNGFVGIGTKEPREALDVVGNIKVGDNENSFWYGGADINLRASSRGSGGRAIVHDGGNVLTVNYDGDFDGGTKISKGVFVKNGGDAAFQGKIEAKEIKVTQSPTADFVFEEGYPLVKLEDIEKHIKEKKHLPEVASAKEMEKEGVNIGEFQIKLLQKIEELTLYSIEQNKLIKNQKQEIDQLKEKNKTFEKDLQMILQQINTK
ncbi:hypothetical protein [Epilithonimonas vandammei]|uniref:hypothetical protein n=1 Tax=Epilithonimonas vandammei TaxID=2487072 RepID=UPI001E42A168|nr:hypothetical protein [Epilithonimonas vandammei]